MAETKFELTDEARLSTGSAWFDYLQVLDPFRPDLSRYCRNLTGNIWDAEDLVQDTLEQGFAKLGSVHHAISYAAEQCMWIADEGVQVLGGHGFIREHPVELWYRNARTLGVLDGTISI